jgi:hypothetical protein
MTDDGRFGINNIRHRPLGAEWLGIGQFQSNIQYAK